jgi:hypothetical protein
MIARLKKHEVEKDPNLVWNTYVGLLASDHDELEPAQRPAGLAFRYDSEVWNGGHLQYFENAGTECLSETIAALGLLEARCQKSVLIDASELYLSSTRSHPTSVEEYVELALEEEFSDFDARFHECSPTLQKRLEEHLERNQSSFIRID